jgi:hypothetical protein
LAACNLGQDVPSALRLPASGPDTQGPEFFKGTDRGRSDDPYDAASVAGSIFRPGPIVEVTDTFLT